MSLLKIPGYYYFGTETFQTSLNLYRSSSLLARIKETPIDYDVSGAALNDISNPTAFANNYLGENVFAFDMQNPNIFYKTGESTPEWVSKMLDLVGLKPIEYHATNNENKPTKFTTLNSFDIPYGNTIISCGRKEISTYNIGLSAMGYSGASCDDQTTQQVFRVAVYVFPDDLFIDNVINPDLENTCYFVMLTVGFIYNQVTGYIINNIHIESASNADVGIVVKNSFNGFNLTNSGSEDKDTNNPFIDDNDNDPGGDGDRPGETIEPTDVPSLPDISAAALGLISIYTPSVAQIQALAGYLWSGAFDPDSFKKLFTDPMECMIGLGIVPAVPSSAGTKNVRFGNVDSGIAMTYVNTQWVSVNCGSVKIEKDIASFLDYDPYTKLSLYLPFIGFRDISCDDVMGGSIQVVYNMDILTGSCSAFVKHSSRGVLYNYNGNCIANIPINAANYSSAIQNAVTTVASGVGVLAGMASGAAPVTAMSAVSMLNSAANTALSSKPTIQRTGNLGGVAGLLSVKKPYLIIQRPNKSVPDYVQNYVGLTCNKTLRLGSCHGFTMVEQVHIDGVSATPGEITEIETLLKQGVIL